MRNRREFVRDVLVLSGVATAWAGSSRAGQVPASAPAGAVQLAGWNALWIGIERVELYRGSVISGRQLYVEYQVPRQQRHPYPLVLVHGNGGQGLDWMTTPDGRPGWLTYLLQEGYAVYVVDLPGMGRVPYSVEFHGPYGQAPTYEQIQRALGVGAAPSGASLSSALPAGAPRHTQWPGTAQIGDPALDQFVASRGQTPPFGPRGAAIWRSRAALLLDTIGPAVFVTHGAGAPFAWGAAEERPDLLKGVVAIEPGSLTFDAARAPAGLARVPIAIVTAEASAAGETDAASVATLAAAGGVVEHIQLARRNIRGNGHFMILEKNNREVLQPILAWLAARAPQPPQARPPASAPRADRESTAIDLAGQGGFFVGVQRKTVPYGTVAEGQTFVQYLVPAGNRRRHSIVLVHGGGGQGTHWTGDASGAAGWAHYFLQEGYAVYLVDCPGYGRSPEHPDATGVTGPARTVESFVGEARRAKSNPEPKWEGTAEVGDPAFDRFIAGEVGFIQRDLPVVHAWWARAAEELLDRIGPSVIVMHTNGGAFGWIAADRRPTLVKGIVWAVVAAPDTPFADRLPWGLTAIPVAYDPPAATPAELRIAPVTPPAGSGRPPYRLQMEPARRLANLAGIPVLLVSGEYDGRAQTPAVAEYLRQAGCPAEHLRLQDRGLRGNGAMVMLETNRRQVFDVLHTWIEQSVKA